MILTLIKIALKPLYDLRMTYVHRTYDNLQTVKVNKTESMTQDGQNLNELLNTSDRDGSQR